MNEEEKAIERCNELIKEEHYCWIGISNQKAIETVLNLIDKQNKVIDEMANDIRLWRLDNAITDNVESIEDIKQYFIRKVKEDVQ